MGRKREFPIKIKAGGTVIRIYSSPQVVRVKKGELLEERQYQSFVVAYYRGGTRHRHRFNSLEDAQTEAERIQTKILNEDLAALQLSGSDRLAYVHASDLAKKFGVPLDLMAKEYTKAREKIGGASLLEAAEFYSRFGRTIQSDKTVPQIVQELVDGLRSDGASLYHVRDMEKRLGAFAEAFPNQIIDLKASAMVEWLRTLVKQDAKGKAFPLAPKTRNHYRNAIVQLFNFAQTNGYLPKGIPTEAEDLATAKVTPRENEVFTVEEMIILLQKAPAHLVPPLAIKAFSGIRTEEMVKICWEHLRWESHHIVLPADVTKTSQRRLIPIAENLVQWLKPHRQETGRIASRWGRPQALVQAFERHGTRLGLDVGGNKFRNSYISYRVALTKDVHRVALESGNSPRVIQREYLELATEAEAKRWFDITPGLPLQPVAAKKGELSGSPTRPKGHVRVKAGAPKRRFVHFPALPAAK
jgi:integrase